MLNGNNLFISFAACLVEAYLESHWVQRGFSKNSQVISMASFFLFSPKIAIKL